MRFKRPSLPKGAADRLSVRLLILMSMALMPLGTISISTTEEVTRAAQRAGERNLIALAADAVAGERALVESALAATRAIESLVLERLGDPEACNAFLQEYAQRSNLYRFIAFVDLDGRTRCVSSGGPLEFGESLVFQQLRDRPTTTIGTSPAGQASGVPVVIVTRPVVDDTALLGFLSISIAQWSIELLARRVVEDAPSAAVLINHAGAVISRGAGSPDMERMPEGHALPELIAEGGNRVFRDTARDGEEAVYALAELIPRRLYALAMWEQGAPQLQALETSRLPLVFPAAMWLASLAVVLLSIHYLVLQHLQRLSRQMRRFALGQRDPWDALPRGAPSEIRDLYGTFRKMARLIARDEEERERALVEKTVLLKELHHRIKNNLQMIASIINLQMRKLDDDQGRRVLRGVQDRVLNLAMVHRALYEEKHLATVRAEHMIEDIVGRIVAMGAAPGQPPALRLRLDPVTLDADRMVPLSFLLSEAITNALKHMGTGDDPDLNWIEVAFWCDVSAEGPATIVLRVTNAMPRHGSDAMAGGAKTDDAGGLGNELIEAFALQLGGELSVGPVEDPAQGRVWQLHLRFSPSDLTVCHPPPEDGATGVAVAESEPESGPDRA